ncbi:hypothetical protein DY000_02017819 [Brassica cretica]|uniref:FLZ-type domain-containing protein n=1 Tax=Brassica cretica TaxID=69181 RepID=A0ABQ7D146_BRACR|nr:hypothetical protein DY000_02017819 [Brassica cretica]
MILCAVPSTPAKIQANPADWIPPFHEASILQEISIEFSVNAWHRGESFCFDSCVVGCAASHSLRLTRAFEKTSVAD